ncbi:M50 family metallopeptidase [soil metagenome]
MPAIFDALINVALLLVILVTLVVIHEFGHFITARLTGVRVHEFGIGFPPRALVIGRDRETEYTLNWLPIGGFVRLEGEEGESDDPRSFVRQGLGKRLVILLSGVAMNFVLAWLIFSFIAGFADPSMTVRIDSVVADSPAESVGLVGGRQTGVDEAGNPIYDDSGDRILAIDGQRFAYFDSPTSIAPTEYLRANAGETVTLTVRSNDGSQRDVPVTLRDPSQVSATAGALGIGIGAVPIGETIARDPVDALTTGLRRTVDASLLVLTALRDLIANFTQPTVSGPIGIAAVVGAVRSPETPPIFFLYFIGLLSANLAVVNALPIPPMDGGRVAVNLIQAVTRNRISVNAERMAYLVGFVLLMAFIVWISYFDIQRLTGS